MHASSGARGLVLAAWVGASACSSSDAPAPGNDGGPSASGGAAGSGGTGSSLQGKGGASQGKAGASSGGAGATGGGASSGGTSSGGAASAGGTTGSGGATASGGKTSSAGDGWLYTRGNKVYVTGDDAEPWVGRGVNVDDVFFCGYNDSLWMESPEQTFKTMISGLKSAWKPTFLRISLGMASYTKTVSWLANPAEYRTPMVDAIRYIGTFPGTYVLVVVRSDRSMIGHDFEHGNPEATGMPSDAATSPDEAAFPRGTDAVYEALVDDFKDSPFVLFGVTNEPGGNLRSDAAIAAAMSHAVSVIRAREDAVGSPHHVIAVQGNSWTSDIEYYAGNPIQSDNIVYEVHGYPPATESYTFANLPVIIGEYGGLPGDGAAFFADLESKRIPSLAWDFQPFSNCAPDLVEVTRDATELVPNAWGRVVQTYLLAHAD